MREYRFGYWSFILGFSEGHKECRTNGEALPDVSFGKR